MIIVRLLSPGPWLVGTTKVYSGVGADIVMESIALIDLVVIQQPLDARHEAGSSLAIIHWEAPYSLASCRTLFPCDRSNPIFSIWA
jgi:hypothetical protein